MSSTTSRDRARALMLAAGFVLAFATPAAAQWPQADGQQDASQVSASQVSASQVSASEVPATETSAPGVGDEDVLKDIDVDKLDWSQLDVDASTLRDDPAAKVRAARAPSSDGGMDWSNRSQANGSSAVSVKQSVSPYWDARVGADMTVAPEPTTMSELLAEKGANGGNLPQSGGSAYAAVTAPGAGSVWDRTAVEARIDPNQDQSKLGTSISKQLSLGDRYSLTLSNGANVTEQGGGIPVPGLASRPETTYQTEQSARLDVTGTGTSLSAGQTLSTSDDKWLRRIGAGQKLFGGVSISGAIGETAQGTTSTSVSAGYKKSW